MEIEDRTREEYDPQQLWRSSTFTVQDAEAKSWSINHAYPGDEPYRYRIEDQLSLEDGASRGSRDYCPDQKSNKGRDKWDRNR